MNILDDEGDLTYGDDGLPLDVFPPSWFSGDAVKIGTREVPEADEPAPTPITVAQLASEIGLPVHAVYRLLERGAVPRRVQAR